MSGTNSNYDSQAWKAHVDSQRAAQRRVTPILEKQAKNDPNAK